MSTARTVAKNTTVLFAAEMGSQVLRFAYFAILVRYIQDTGMGTISTAQALVGTLFVLISFGLEQLMVRDVAADKTRAAEYVSSVGFIRTVLALLFALALWIAVEVMDYPAELKIITYIYGVSFVIKAFTDIGLAIYQAFEKMEYLLITRLVRDVVNIALSLLAIYLGLSLVVIVAVSVLANLVELVLTATLLRRQKVPIRLRPQLALSRRLMWAALPLAVVSIYPLAESNLNTLILSRTSSVEAVGWFAAATTLLGMIKLVPLVLMRAMFPVFARASNEKVEGEDPAPAAGRRRVVPGGLLQRAYQASFNYLFILGLALSVGTFLTAEQIVPLVFGEGFEAAVPALKVLAWIPVVSFVGYANGNLLIASGREKFFMLSQGVFALMYAGLAFLLVPPFGYIGASYAMLGPTVIGFFFYSVVCHRLLDLALPWKRGLATTAAAALMAVMVYYSLHVGTNLFAVILVVGPLGYGAALYVLRVLSREDLLLVKRVLKP